MWRTHGFGTDETERRAHPRRQRGASAPPVQKLRSMISTAVVPAAGRAERFGGGKLLADIRGEPLLQHALRSLLDGGVTGVVVVVAPGVEFPGVALMTDSRVLTIENPDPSRGMFSSIQAGFAHATGSPMLVLPADMPFVRSETVQAVLDAGRSETRVIIPAYRRRRGHPIAIPGHLRAKLSVADPNGSLRDALAALGADLVTIDVDDEGVLRDVDVRRDLHFRAH